VNAHSTVRAAKLRPARRRAAGRAVVVALALALAPAAATADAGPAEPTFKLDDLRVAEARLARAREAAGRMVAIGLGRHKSLKRGDAHKVVCEKLMPSGSHIARVRCAANATWVRAGASSVGKLGTLHAMGTPWGPIGVLLQQATANTPYHVRIEDGLFLEFSTNVLKLADEYAATETEQVERLRQVLAEHRLIGVGVTSAAQVDETLRFAHAFMAVGRLARRAATPAGEDELAAAIRQAGISIDAYNAMIERLETDARLRDRIALVQMTYELEF
jgi:hypothetical protein